MKERPILFSGPMVRAILAGTKTQTRRIVKHQYAGTASVVGDGVAFLDNGRRTGPDQRCPYGAPGDRLWVRERFRGPYAYEVNKYPLSKWGNKSLWYCADGDPCPEFERQFWPKSRPSIHMPRWASRITLEITDVRVERLQEISEADAVAEGVIGLYAHARTNPRGAYWALWDSINGAGSWDANPWVWALTFRRVLPGSPEHQEKVARQKAVNDALAGVEAQQEC